MLIHMVADGTNIFQECYGHIEILPTKPKVKIIFSVVDLHQRQLILNQLACTQPMLMTREMKVTTASSRKLAVEKYKAVFDK